MRDVLDICRAAAKGPTLSEQDFDLDRVYTTAAALVDKYGLEFEPGNPVPSDDDLADRVWQAALEFFVDCGVYFKDEQRVVTFTRDEVEADLAAYSGRCQFGEGPEARVFTSRKPDSDVRPWCHVGAGTVSSREEYAAAVVRGNAAIAAADSMSVPALDAVDGHPIVAGTPAEIRGAIRSIQIARKACADAGRPGLPIINGVAAAGSARGTIAASSHASGWRESDCVIVGTLAEFKTSSEMMTKVVWCQESPTRCVLASAPIMGGFAGGPEAMAIINAAYAIWCVVVYQADYYLSLPMDLRKGCGTTREVLWASSVSNQAIARNTNIPTLALPYANGGPMTELYYYEAAAATIAAIASGVSFQTTHPAGALFADLLTPMEMRGCVEMALGATGMTRKDASPLVDKLLTAYEDKLADPDRGKPFPECFDVASGQPTSEHIKLVQRTKRQLADLGVDFVSAER
ncbi:MAG: monomethylamine:corrinoid methyltransferase [Planctomycetota bacterium]|jgi:methylamine--corrinoid protein Co-methyltransferase